MAGIGYNRPKRDARTRHQFPPPGAAPAAADAGGDAGSLPVCPGCGRSDEVRAVQAVFLDGHRHVREETGTGSERRTVTREVVSRLARALAPVPPKPSTSGRGCLGVLLVMVSIITFLVGVQAGHWFTGSTPESRPEYPYRGWNEAADGPEVGLHFLGVISVVALLGAVLLFRAVSKDGRSYRARTEPGLAAAERLWLQGWYCARCAAVHFDGGRALSLQEFRVQVWTAGGYGDLAETHRAVDLTADS